MIVANGGEGARVVVVEGVLGVVEVVAIDGDEMVGVPTAEEGVLGCDRSCSANAIACTDGDEVDINSSAVRSIMYLTHKQRNKMKQTIKTRPTKAANNATTGLQNPRPYFNPKGWPFVFCPLSCPSIVVVVVLQRRMAHVPETDVADILHRINDNASDPAPMAQLCDVSTTGWSLPVRKCPFAPSHMRNKTNLA